MKKNEHVQIECIIQKKNKKGISFKGRLTAEANMKIQPTYLHTAVGVHVFAYV